MSEQTSLPAGAAARLASVPMPPRIAALKRDRRGYPIPRFIDRSADIDGDPDFRIMDGTWLIKCVKQRKCWICGNPLGRYMTFPIGPMCVINRNIAEPPSHLECCHYSVKVCPFLAVPAMRRIKRGMPEGAWVSGEMIPRNPGVLCLWAVEKYRAWKPAPGEILFDIGEPTAVEWWSQGRAATRAEVDAAIASGLPLLEDACRKDPQPGALEALARSVAAAQKFLPEITNA